MTLSLPLMSLYEALGGIALAYARVAVCFLFLPFLNNSVLTGTAMRNAVIVLVLAGLWPAIGVVMPAFQPLDLLLMAAKEAAVGLALGMALAMPFWVFHAVGSWIDNQRGATISSSIDPLNGIESSEMSSFLHLLCVVAFLESGGMRHLLEALLESYRVLGLLQWQGVDVHAVLAFLPTLLRKSLALAAPVLLVLFLSELLLGVLARFTPQLNAFSISLGIKSVIALTVLLMYFMPVLSARVDQLYAPRPLELLLPGR